MEDLIYLEIGEVSRVGSRIVMCLLDINSCVDNSIDRCQYCCFRDDKPQCDKMNCIDCFRTDFQSVFYAEVKSIDLNVLLEKLPNKKCNV